MEDELTKCLTGFRKSHGPQHSLLTMLEKWKRGIDKRMSLLYGPFKIVSCNQP